MPCRIYTIIELLGIITLSLLVLTSVCGLFRRKMPRWFVKRHKYLGIITLAFALTHAAIVLIAL